MGMAEPPAFSLPGETFTSHHVNGSTLTGGCNFEGGASGFSVSGTATGPFPGTFTESGSFGAASPSVSASWMRSPARRRITIQAAQATPGSIVSGRAHDSDDLFDLAAG